MADSNFKSGANSTNCFKEAVCVNAARIYDSCSDKDCLEDLQVYFTDTQQPVIDAALSVKCRKVEVLNVFLDVEPVPFNKGFYSVDMTFFFKVHIDAYSSPVACPTTCVGLAIFSKKVILYGSEGGVKVFSSDGTSSGNSTGPCGNLPTNAPKASVQVVNPICLSCKICDYCPDCCMSVNAAVPEGISGDFDGAFGAVVPEKVVFITIGLFSICQIERQVQMMIPVYDFCIPDKECVTTTDDPCELFKRIKFPVNEFFPPRLNDLECRDELTPSDFEC